MAVPSRSVGERAPKAADGAIRGRALGLTVEAPSGFAGLRGGADPGDDRWVRLDLVSQPAIDSAWPGSNADEAHRSATPSSGSGVLTEHHPDAGYLITAPDGSRCLVDVDGHRIRAATAHHRSERWQSFVATQALPLAAILQGLEVFNASAVVVAGQVMAFAGPAGVGKSALAARLMLVGALFFADDLVALEVRRGHVIAHSGLGVARLGERGRSAVPQLAAQGDGVIGRDGKTLVDCSRHVPTLPLRSLYLLSPAAQGVDPTITAELPDSSRLLAGTHNLSVRTPERLRRHLELVALMGARVGTFGVQVPRGAKHDVARAIFAHAALEVLL